MTATGTAASDERQIVDQPSTFTGTVLVLGGVAIVLAGMHGAAEILSPILLGVVLALIFFPLLVWIRGHGLPGWLSLILLLVGIILSSLLLGAFIWYSVMGLSAQMTVYAANWSAQLQQVDAWLQQQGLSGASLASTFPPEAVVSLFGVLVGGLASTLRQVLVILLLLSFFLAEGPAMFGRLRGILGESDPHVVRLTAYGRDVGRYFALRALVNAVTGAGVTLVLWLLGVDFPLLWGVLTFFLSFIPYIGMFLASVPSVLLAWAEFGLGRALVVVVALTLANAVAENLLQPALMSRGLHLSPTFVFISVMFWSWLIGGSGSFLAVPLSLGLLATFASFSSCRWLVAALTRH